ncbi:MAG TPA: hypothetical protein VGA62_08920 [Acidimicrobiia bacterium]
MTRSTRSRRVAEFAAPHLLGDEHVVAAGPVWAAFVPRSARLLFRGRHLRWLVLTERRLLMFDHRRRRRDLLLAKSLNGLRLERSRTAGPLLQVLIDGGVDRLLVLEFPRRDRAFGHAVVLAVSTGADWQPAER